MADMDHELREYHYLGFDISSEYGRYEHTGLLSDSSGVARGHGIISNKNKNPRLPIVGQVLPSRVQLVPRQNARKLCARTFGIESQIE
jgi:hypothetical protein